MWKHQAGAASPPQPQKGHTGRSLAKPGLVSLVSLDRQHPGFSILIREESQISLSVEIRNRRTVERRDEIYG